MTIAAYSIADVVDKDFGDALDGMIIVNLLDVPEKVLGRYMGKEAASAYRAPKKTEQAA